MAKELDQNKMSKLKDAMGRASKLIQLESTGALDKIARGARDGIGQELLGNSDMNAASLMTTVDRNTVSVMRNTTEPIGESKLPNAILESFKKNPISEAALYSSMNGNGSGDELDFLTESVSKPTPREVEKPKHNVKNIIRESVGQTTTVQQQGIDYPMIRTIVEDIVRKYAQSLNKRIISEGKENGNSLNTLAIGKSFKFLDDAGNIYICEMKKIGNIKNKKKSTID